MTKTLKWRLGKLPTPDEVLKLVNDKLITKEEARDILFAEQNSDERDAESLQDEIKFLRELVHKLSNDKTKVVEVIREIKVPYYQYLWYQPYQNWCTAFGSSSIGYVSSGNSITLTGTSATGTNAAFYTAGLSASEGNGTLSAGNFSDIETF